MCGEWELEPGSTVSIRSKGRRSPHTEFQSTEPGSSEVRRPKRWHGTETSRREVQEGLK